MLPELPFSAVLTKQHDDSWAACMSTTSVMYIHRVSVRPTCVKLLFNVICIKDVTSFPDIKLLHAYNAHESLSKASNLNRSAGKLSKECVFGTKKRYSRLLDNDKPTSLQIAQPLTNTNSPRLAFKSCIFRAEYVYL